MTATRHNIDTLQKGFKLDLKGIFVISQFLKKPLKPKTFKIAFALAAVFFFLIIVLNVSVYETVIELKSLGINLLPSLLGFTIGGYSFIVGFLQPRLMDRISEPIKDSNYSLFQVTSASFACNIILQALALIVFYIIHFISWIDIKAKLSGEFNIALVRGINIFTLALALLCFSISLAVIIQLVINVFNFSQLHHYDVNKEKLDKKNDNAE